ncbi:hypothetical protein O6H91_09G030300 [Diphasiastrum complanatum]|uniref:Uncharacterized protein n=1 Tax=Diphasiastrum complanatum TaxID=34168 RepID=A0ACC2CMS1_DIPCM|nr:hypothetical protein O6H91_09G030300 [Diphasiastrum complanatum]
MERLLKKYEQKYKRVKEHLVDWKALQEQLLNLSSNACSILDRLQVLSERENFGVLKDVENIVRDLPAKQVESLECIFQSMNKTLVELEKVSKSIEKSWHDGCNLLRAERPQPTLQQAQQRIGSRPSLNDCLDGLKALYTMHHDEYKLKVDIVSSLSYTLSSSDLTALQTILAEQPNIPPDEVQHIFDLVLGGDS